MVDACDGICDDTYIEVKCLWGREMENGFDIKNGVLEKYNGTDAQVMIPSGVTEIGYAAFMYCKHITSVVIPNTVTEIGPSAFLGCSNLAFVSIPHSVTKIQGFAFYDCKRLKTITIPRSVEMIGKAAFKGCARLADKKGFVIRRDVLYSYHGQEREITIPDGVSRIGAYAFEDRRDLTSVTLPGSVTEIEDHAFRSCENLTTLTIPDSVTKIGKQVFEGCRGLGVFVFGDVLYSYCGDDSSVSVPEGVRVIEEFAFEDRVNLTSVTLPEGLTKIGYSAFRGCRSLNSITLPDTLTEIEDRAFDQCENLRSAVIPDSVTNIGNDSFDDCPKVTVVCSEESEARQYCIDKEINYIFDYQYKAYNGLLPQGFEKLASPFLADEEKPYIFISYSHKDRDEVLEIIKNLYESGWKVWYDEGLTIGDRYDETLEEHAKNSSAFLLFVSENSLNSFYVKENEIPWALESGKPVIKCILDEGKDYLIPGDSVIATVSPEDIEPALEKIDGLKKGARREAKGISVVVDPANRETADGNGFAYCIYSGKNADSAKTILLEAANSGCTIYDAAENGEDAEKLQDCACLIVFLDKAFFSDKRLTEILTDHYQSHRDIAVCQLEDIEEKEIPRALEGSHLMQWLNYVHGITADMNTKLARHLQKRGCRDSKILPGYEYEETGEGIVITKYTGMDPDPRIDREYGGVPVVEIGQEAFENCVRLKSVTIDGAARIGDSAFSECSNLTTVVLGDGLREIGERAFHGCISLKSVIIPDGVEVIGVCAFEACKSLTSLTLPDSVTEIREAAFEICEKLDSFAIPQGITEIGPDMFWACKNLRSVTIPDSVTMIGEEAFYHCSSLESISIPGSVTEIGAGAFRGCTGLRSILVPDSVKKIDGGAFDCCSGLTSVTVPEDAEISYTAFCDCTGLVDNEGFLIVDNVLYSYHGNASEVTVPDNVTRIATFAFDEHPNLTSVTIPKSVRTIDKFALDDSDILTVTCPPRSRAWQYCKENGIQVKASAESARTGLFSKLFGK